MIWLGASSQKLSPLYFPYMSVDSSKTFYLETFGCQMNVHDSEKVVGTLPGAPSFAFFAKGGTRGSQSASF
jgi:hypothetical protein